jgi:hypothetical protein
MRTYPLSSISSAYTGTPRRFGRFARGGGSVGGTKKDLRVGVFQIEIHLVFAVSGIQRRGRSRHRRREETHDGRQAVRQIGRHAVASPDAHRRQRIRHFSDLIAQLFVSDADARLGQDDRGIPGGRSADDFQKVWDWAIIESLDG